MDDPEVEARAKLEDRIVNASLTVEAESEVTQEQVAMEMESTQLEVVSIGEQDLLPSTPTLESHKVSMSLENSTNNPNSESAEQTDASNNVQAQCPGMKMTKVQPFLSGDQREDKTFRSRLFARRMELLIGVCVLLTVTFVLGIGLGVGLSCRGKFRCSSSLCVSVSAQCDGHIDCENGVDELGCVRVSGRSSVLQVLSGGVWSTVCSEMWNSDLGFSACKQLGYPSHVESGSIPLTSIEQDLRDNLVSINLSHQNSLQPIKIHNTSNLSFAYPPLWTVLAGLTEQPVTGANHLTVEKIIYHGRYRPKGLDYDIALLKLSQPLTFNGLVCVEAGGSDELGSGLRREKQARSLHSHHTSSYLDSPTDGGQFRVMNCADIRCNRAEVNALLLLYTSSRIQEILIEMSLPDF
ncbi:Transmembrane protease serine 3 [Bagarius yarrelli]|uniref:Transmembrane protease serine 3 n=1 Tax=Bagarius yarrelli TaxID=175774 RepID=A0A556U031_BAGYA|nr:Transmembrane protease serine 3 [Bagarius yarrelli]